MDMLGTLELPRSLVTDWGMLLDTPVPLEPVEQQDKTYSQEVLNLVPKVITLHDNIVSQDQKCLDLKYKCLQEAIVCGQFLTEIKKKVPGGMFENFCKEHLHEHIKKTTIYVYRQLFYNQDEIGSCRSIRQACIRLGIIKPDKSCEHEYEDNKVEEQLNRIDLPEDSNSDSLPEPPTTPTKKKTPTKPVNKFYVREKDGVELVYLPTWNDKTFGHVNFMLVKLDPVNGIILEDLDTRNWPLSTDGKTKLQLTDDIKQKLLDKLKPITDWYLTQQTDQTVDYTI